MAAKPKPFFWITMTLVIMGLVGFALFRAGIIGTGNQPVDQSVGGGTTTPLSGRPGGVLDVTLYSSSAKQLWIDEMVKTFNVQKQRIGGQIIRVSPVHVTSGGSFEDLKSGKIKPDMWSPGDESWLQLAAMHWRNVKQKELFQKSEDLVDIPLVIAMWEPMAKVLGYPEPIGWRDIAKIAATPDSWTTLGHPEWGQFRWGHAHPDANSGFLTIISEVYAALGKTEGISREDLKTPEVRAFLSKIEGAVEHYGLSNSWIDDLMHKKGPAYLSATVQYENTIIQTNRKNQNKPFKLVAIYPREGNFRTRHPIAVLDEAWMTPQKKEACERFIGFLLSETAQTRAMALGLRPIMKQLAMAEPFTSEWGVTPQITSDKTFRVPDEEVLKRIRDLWENVKIPATIVLVLDRSGSMKGPPLDRAKEGAVQFVRKMQPRDELRVVVFNEYVTLLSDLCFMRTCGEDIVTRIEGVFSDGKTALYDAIAENYKLLNQLRRKNPKRRYSLLVLSDGQDTASKIDRYDFLDGLPRGEDFDAPKIFSIAYGAEADRDLLTEVANRTNGRIFESTPEQIAKTYKELSANF